VQERLGYASIKVTLDTDCHLFRRGYDSAKLKGQLMLAHGTGDDNVHFANTTEVLNQMIDNNRYPAALMIFPGRGHPIGDAAARIQLFERITEFFLKNL
jgi:dipeptidyl-peptidase-4